MRQVTQRLPDGECRLCPCPKSEPAKGGCVRGIHPAHEMVWNDEAGYWYCPDHDLPNAQFDAEWATTRDLR